ncbi:MAG: hypothetical protein F4Z00_04975 [Acidimicrobiaceae bacterium]|nr:hypothetical protein [Acidimicrobiaceae bacterium]MXZ64888.1 hypothetical protein [Acidimicrobiaceae bacterium]MYE66324.1 hypothetical protein [Acidimicrobiaceae bacterium]MYF33228.1 hypothetical protein [Acidimicrobiaceae bacterium]MYL03433.1 hypothetical protein [Acidimicrobiaceae bacterium]
MAASRPGSGDAGVCVADVDIVDRCIAENRLACYVPALRGCDDGFRLRIVLHGFGTVWRDADRAERVVLAAEEPERFDRRWDAFLAAYIEYLCGCDGLQAPAWTRQPQRYLEQMWWSGDYFGFERGRVVVTTPAVFEAHGVWIADSDLVVV